MTDFAIREVPAQPTAAIRVQSPMEDIGEAMSQAFPKLYQAVSESGAVPAGAPLARYFSFGGPTIDFECAIPLVAPFAGAGEVRPGEIGGCEAAFAVHVGPYDTIAQTWETLGAWVEAQGRAPSGPAWEHYLTDPSAEPDPTQWVTEVYMPLA